MRAFDNFVLFFLFLFNSDQFGKCVRTQTKWQLNTDKSILCLWAHHLFSKHYTEFYIFQRKKERGKSAEQKLFQPHTVWVMRPQCFCNVMTPDEYICIKIYKNILKNSILFEINEAFANLSFVNGTYVSRFGHCKIDVGFI